MKKPIKRFENERKERKKMSFATILVLNYKLTVKEFFFHIMQQNEIKICLMIPFKFNVREI